MTNAPPELTTLYYDPTVDVHHRVSAAGALTTAFYAAPQVPEDARRLLDAAVASLGWDRGSTVPLRPTRGAGSTLVLAREWGLTDLEARLRAAIEESYEPTWDRDRGEFTWGLGLGEEHPRGQYNAFLAAADAAAPGLWSRLSAAPLQPSPQVVDIDFPTVAVRRAEWVRGALHLGLEPLHENPRGRTTFRIVGAEPRIWDFMGVEGASIEYRASGVIVTMPLVKANLEFTPGSY